MSASEAKSSALYAAAKEIGAHCAVANEAFLRCKAADAEPSACLTQGTKVQECALGVLKSAMENCGDTFQKYADCLDKQISQEYMFERCRKPEAAFVECRSLTAQSGYEGSSAPASGATVVAAAPAADEKGTTPASKK